MTNIKFNGKKYKEIISLQKQVSASRYTYMEASYELMHALSSTCKVIKVLKNKKYIIVITDGLALGSFLRRTWLTPKILECGERDALSGQSQYTQYVFRSCV
jgi:hypothetical protein